MPQADPHTPYGMTEVLPVADISLAGARGSGPRRRRLRRAGPCRGVTVAVSPLAADGTSEGDPVTTAGRDRRGLRAGRARQGPLRPALGHRTRERPHARLAPHRRRRPPGRPRPALGRGPARARGHRPPTVRSPRSGSSSGSRPLAEVAAAAVRRRRPAGTQQVVVVVVPSADGTAGRPRRPADLAGAVRAAAGSRSLPCSSTPALPVDIRHASKVDRAAVARWAERVLAGGRVGPPVRVLVTGASGMLGGGVARALHEPRRRTSPCCSGVRPGCGAAGGPRRRRRPDRGGAGRARAGRRGAPGRQGQRDRRLGRLRAGQRRRHPARSSRPAAPPACARLVHVSSPSVAHAGSALVGAGAGPADPRRARGHYARSKAVAERLALRADGPRPRRRRGPPAPGLGARGHPAGRAGSSTGPAPGGCP